MEKIRITKEFKFEMAHALHGYDGLCKNITKYFDAKILKLNNISIVNLDHNELELLQLKGLLDKDLIKPLYLS